MFALLAVICFAVEFVLRLVGTNTGEVDLVVLGLAFVAAHLLLGSWPAGLTFRRRD